jgi:hypothetical protein
MSNELLDMENVSGSDTAEYLKELVVRVKHFDFDKERLFTPENSKAFAHVVNLLGDTPPIKMLEDLLDYYKKIRHRLVTDEIPAAMNAMGMDKINLDNGISVKLKTEVSVKTENKFKLISWLIKNGYQNEVKDVLAFNKGELDKEATKFLSDKGYTYKKDTSIHWQTLTRIMRERLEAGEKLPPETTAIIKQYNIAKVK